MSTIWTPYNPTSTPDWNQLEPVRGFGYQPFGDEDKTLSIHSRGFGQPTTRWTEHEGD